MGKKRENEEGRRGRMGKNNVFVWRRGGGKYIRENLSERKSKDNSVTALTLNIKQ